MFVSSGVVLQNSFSDITQTVAQMIRSKQTRAGFSQTEAAKIINTAVDHMIFLLTVLGFHKFIID